MPAKLKVRPPTVTAPYDPAWPGIFEREKQLIQRALKGQVLRIDHIGSTAIPGMPAKPIIVILVAVADFGDLVQNGGALTAIGYVPGRQEMPGGWFFKKNVEGIAGKDGIRPRGRRSGTRGIGVYLPCRFGRNEPPEGTSPPCLVRRTACGVIR